MATVNAISFEKETPMTVWFVLTSQDGSGVIGQRVVKTVGFDPLLYSGSLTPTNGQVIPHDKIVDRAAGGEGDAHVVSAPPPGWDGSFVLLSTRLKQLKASGVFLPGTDGRPDPFNSWKPPQTPAWSTVSEQLQPDKPSAPVEDLRVALDDERTATAVLMKLLQRARRPVAEQIAENEALLAENLALRQRIIDMGGRP